METGGTLNHIMIQGRMTHCSPFEDAIGCWGWLVVGTDTAIGYRAFGETGTRLLEVMRSSTNRSVILRGKLDGKPADVIVEHWTVS